MGEQKENVEITKWATCYQHQHQHHQPCGGISVCLVIVGVASE